MTPQDSPHITWRSILGGEVLVHLMRKQANLIILIMILVILYIDNRYSSQQEMIEIDRLKKELIDTKYDALTISSELTEEKPPVAHLKSIFLQKGLHWKQLPHHPI